MHPGSGRTWGAHTLGARTLAMHSELFGRTLGARTRASHPGHALGACSRGTHSGHSGRTLGALAWPTLAAARRDTASELLPANSRRHPSLDGPFRRRRALLECMPRVLSQSAFPECVSVPRVRHDFGPPPALTLRPSTSLIARRRSSMSVGHAAIRPCLVRGAPTQHGRFSNPSALPAFCFPCLARFASRSFWPCAMLLNYVTFRKEGESNFSECKPMHVQVRPIPDPSRNWTESGQVRRPTSLVRSRPTLTQISNHFGTHAAGFEHHSPEIDCIWPESGQLWHDFVQTCATRRSGTTRILEHLLSRAAQSDNLRTEDLPFIVMACIFGAGLMLVAVVRARWTRSSWGRGVRQPRSHFTHPPRWMEASAPLSSTC